MDIEIITENQTLAKILKEAFTPEQIQHLLETIYNYPEYDSCPLCGEEDIAIDAQGNPLPDDATLEEWSNASWRSAHDEDCLVTWLSKQQDAMNVPEVQNA